MWSFWKKKEKIDMRWAFGALVAYIVMMVVNYLGGATTLLGGTDTAGISDSFPNLFAPAPHTFAIWGLIYLATGLFFFRVFEIVKTGKKQLSNSKLNEVIVFFTLTSLANAGWMLAWQYKVLWLSVLLMIVLLVLLARINVLLAKEQLNPAEHGLVRAPFSIYFGWITVATIANVTTWLVSMNWDRFGLSEGTWMVAALLVGAGILLVTATRHRDWLYLSVGVWAYAGILFKHLSVGGFDGRYPSTLAALYILLPVFISVMIALCVRWPFGARSTSLLNEK